MSQLHQRNKSETVFKYRYGCCSSKVFRCIVPQVNNTISKVILSTVEISSEFVALCKCNITFVLRIIFFKRTLLVDAWCKNTPQAYLDFWMR